MRSNAAKAVFGFSVAAAGLLLWSSVVHAAPPSITVATGGGAILADTAQGAAGAAFTSLTGPVLTEAGAADIGTGSIILNAPSGFRFDTSATITLTPTGGGCDIDIGAGAATLNTATPAASTITFTVASASTAACVLTYTGVTVQPTAGTPLASGKLTFSGTSTASGNAGALAEIAGSPTNFLTQSLNANNGGGTPTTSLTAGTAFAVRVTARDQFNNTATSVNGGTVDLSFTTTATNSPNATAPTVTAQSGAKTFTSGITNVTGFILTNASETPTITATVQNAGGANLAAPANGVTGATAALTVANGAGLSMTVFTQPSATSVAGVAFAQQPVIRILDASGNLVTTGTDATATVTASLQTGAGTLTGTAAKAAVAGVADFSANALKIDLVGTDKVLRFTATLNSVSRTVDSSPAFTIRHAAADHLVTVAPAGPQTAGVSFNLTTITAVDLFGNVADGANGSTAYAGAKTLTYALSGASNGPTSGTDSFTTSVSFTAGLATTTLATTLDRAQSTTIKAQEVGLSGTHVASVSFTVNPGAVSALVITQQPSNVAVLAAIAPAMTVQIRDAFGNLRASDTTNVVAAVGTNPSASVLAGTTTRAAVAGIATFNDLTLSVAGNGYTLGFTSAGATAATSNTFNVGATATITGTIQGGANSEGALVAGGGTIIVTIADDTLVAAGATFDAQRQAIINGLTSGGAAAAGWNATVKPALSVGNVVRTSATVITITLPAVATYDIASSETITVTVPGAALVSGSAIVGSPTFNVLPASAAVTGTIQGGANTEAGVVAGGGTVILTLTNGNWVAAGATFDAQRQNIINGLTSAAAEAAGWNATVKTGLVVGNVVRTSATVVTITLPAIATYNITASETVTATIPATAIGTASGVVASSPFSLVPTSASLSGSLSSGVPSSTLTSSGGTIIVTLTNGTWVAAGATFDAQRQNIINGLTSAGAEAAGWNAAVRGTLAVAAVVRTSATIVTVTVPATAAYSIGANETVSVTIPATAIGNAGSVVATPTFTISAPIVTPDPGTGGGSLFVPPSGGTAGPDVVGATLSNVNVGATTGTSSVNVGTTSSTGVSATVSVPAGALPAGTTVQVASVTNDLALANAAPPPSGASLVSGFQINAMSSGIAVTTLAVPVSLTFTVPASSVPAGSTAGNITLAFWSGTSWVTTPAVVTVNADGSLSVTASVTHFTLFSVQRINQAPPAPVAAPGGFGGAATFSSTGLALAVFNGGTVTQLESAAVAQGATGVWVQGLGGVYRLLVVGGPAFLRDTFAAAFPNGLSVSTAVTLTKSVAATPAAALATPAAAAAPRAVQSYTVLPGDTLSGIGVKVGVDWQVIAVANNIAGPTYAVRDGQVLTIPAR